MATAEKLPFSWHSVESLPDLERLRLVLDTLADEEIVAALEVARGRGRNDYEVPVAFEVTRASDPEAKILPKMLETLFARAPQMADRCDDFSADRGLDSAPQKKQLWDKWSIRPLIDTRLMWRVKKEEPDYDPTKPITRALFPDRADVIVHDERGRVSCVCPETGEARAMAFQGFEADRGACGTLKY